MREDMAVEAWRTVRRVRDAFVGQKREPADENWVEAIQATLERLTKDGGYDAGYEDALDEIESTVQDAQSSVRARKRRASIQPRILAAE